MGLHFARERRSRTSAFAVALAIASVSLPALAEEEKPLDLVGTWFLLVHYRDSATANPDADRWEDKVWTIEKKGSRLHWTEYPIVVFEDRSGRFGRVGRNLRARMLVKWEPNASQLAEIEAGPRINKRGSKTKSLRGSPKRGYRSGGGARSASALTIGYQETWSIDDPTTLPVFTRDDALGAESELATGGDVISGRTRYATRQVLDEGGILTGTYARDENKRGTFRLIRAGAVRGLPTDGKTPNEKQRERQREMFRAGVQDVAYRRFLESLGDENVRELRAQLGEQRLSDIWSKYEKRIIGEDPRAPRELSDALRDAYVASLVTDAVGAVRDWDDDAIDEARSQGDLRKVELLENLQDTLGPERIASLHDQYGEDLRDGDARAEQAVRKEIRSAYAERIEAEFRARLEAGDPEAIRQLKDMRRKERDRR